MARGGPDEVRVNQATARALAGAEGWEGSALDGLARRQTRAGRTAGYNLGTWLGRRGDLDSALAALRGVLRQDPGDEDARWNYEVLLRLARERARRPEAAPPKPKPASASASRPQPMQAPKARPAPTAAAGGAMNRAQAERLLDALGGLEQSERERKRRTRVGEAKQERDW